MPLLQVRDFPEPLYRALEERAKEERRSISQQTIVLLSNELGSPQDNHERRKRVLQRLDDLHQKNAMELNKLSDPVVLIREDRER